MTTQTSKDNPRDLLHSLSKMTSNPTEKEFFNRTYLKGENTQSVLKDMRLGESYVNTVIESIARQSRKPAGEQKND